MRMGNCTPSFSKKRMNICLLLVAIQIAIITAIKMRQVAISDLHVVYPENMVLESIGNTSSTTIADVSSGGRIEMQQDGKVETIQKGLHNRSTHYHSGLSPMVEMALETSALRRIQKYCGHTNHFPIIVTADNKSMTSTSVGTPLDYKSGNDFLRSHQIQFQDLLVQVNTIIECLRKSHVRHLDTLPGRGGCKNIALSKNKTIALFDFDISVIDEKPLSPPITKRFNKMGPTFEEYATRLRISMMECFFKNVTRAPVVKVFEKNNVSTQAFVVPEPARQD